MIYKVNQGMSFSGLINYITNELKDGHIIASNGVSTVSKESILDSFAIQCKMGTTNTSYPVGHFALSWHKDERSRMTDAFMAQLAREFMDELGYGQTQYVVTVHNDTDHPHCHIAYNRVGNDGKALNNSFLKRRAIKACRALEKLHNLRPTVASKLDNVNDAKLRGKDKAKFALKKTVLNISRQCRTWKEFENELAKVGVKMSFRYSKDNVIKGIIFSDNEHSFGGKSLHADLSLTNLDKRFGNKLAKDNFFLSLPHSAVVPVELPNGYKPKVTVSSMTKPVVKASPKESTGTGTRSASYTSSLASSSLASNVVDTVNEVAEDIIISARNVIEVITAPLLTVDTTAISMGGGGQSNNDLDRKKKDDDDIPQAQTNTGYRRRGRR